MPSILSTKVLSPSQKQLLLNAGLSLTQYNFIQTQALDLAESISEESYPNVIVTSQTTVDVIKDFKIETCFCVGEKTAAKLKLMGFKVEVIAETGQDLAQNILNHYSDLSFTFFGSAKRRPELSETLQKAKIVLAEIFVYDSFKTPKSYNRNFDAVLCFSPLGVESFFEAHPNSTAKLICIGPTTARQAQQYSDAVYVSTTTSVESVIVKAVKVMKE